MSIMMKFSALAACMLFAMPAFAQSTAEKTGINSVTGVSPSTPDFVTEAAISDMFEIQESKLAADRGNSATKAFATQMVTDHTKTSTELKGMLPAGVTPPAALDNAHQNKLDKLTGLNGNDFEKQYRSDQVSAHKSAVSLFKRYAKGGDNAALKTWAGTTLPTLEAHLKMAQDLDKNKDLNKKSSS
jgi:putative membrane protein